MNDALTAAGDLFRSIPVKIRRSLYGLLGVFVVFEPIFDIFPTSVDEKVYAVFGVFTVLMALANSQPAPFDDGPFDGSPVPPNYPDEFA